MIDAGRCTERDMASVAARHRGGRVDGLLGAPYVASPLILDNLIYYTKERQGILSCTDAATGEPKYGPERLPGIDTIYASLAGAAGKIYIAGREGTTLVLRHGPKFEVLASNRLDEGVDASPVLLGKELYLRGSKSLYRIEAP
jgi:hypothetical protein